MKADVMSHGHLFIIQELSVCLYCAELLQGTPKKEPKIYYNDEPRIVPVKILNQTFTPPEILKVFSNSQYNNYLAYSNGTFGMLFSDD